MALSTAVNSIDSLIGHNNTTGDPVELSSPQFCDTSEPEDDSNAMRLPNMDKKQPLEKDANELMTDSDSDQQQQQSLLNSTSSSSCSFDHNLTQTDLPSSQHVQHMKKSSAASSSGGSHRRRGNLGIKAAKQRFLLEKAAKQQKAKAASEKVLKAGKPRCEMPSKSSAPLLNASGVSKTSSSMSSTSRTSTQQKAAPQPMVPLTSRPLYAQEPTSANAITTGLSNQPSSHGRPNSALQHPVQQNSNNSTYLSSAMKRRKHSVQNDWVNTDYLFIKVCDLPDSITTHDLWTSFKHEGHITYIHLYENAQGHRNGGARVKFSPPLPKAFWERGRYPIQLAGGRKILAKVFNETRKQLFLPYPEIMVRCPSSNASTPTNIPPTMYAQSVDFGIMLDKTKMMNMHTVLPTRETAIKFCMNMFHKEISVEFPIHVIDPRAISNGPNMRRGKYDRTELFQFRIPFTQLKAIHRIAGQGHKLILLISLETPPKFFKQLDPSKSHDDEAGTWSDNDMWYRQTDIVYVPNGLRKSSLTWKKTNPIIDLGRWTTYRLVVNLPKNGLLQFDQMREALRDHNVEIVPFPDFSITPRHEAPVWNLIDLPLEKRRNTGTGLEEMIHANKPRMAFGVRYQLEVCLSQGFLNEHNLSANFITILMNMNVKQAQDLLEYIANRGNRIYDPMLLIEEINGGGLLSRAKIPSYCAYIRSATITPTTVYFQTPVAEISNRVIREFSQYADRFLRVRFTEEKTEGKIHPTPKDTMNEVFTRVKRVLTNGISIGDRTYEFLACGNAQFREHGAYFFAPLPNLTTEKIRKWMGMFKEIKTVALYASRLGQCFSTTRVIRGARANLAEIPDIKRNGHNFTDGVGRISPFLAHLAASELGILQHSQGPPSVFQIRVGGCKGVLAVSPDSVGRQIHIRKSQYKFPAMHDGLEIIRWSQYTVANLNRQLVLILSSLGVPDQVFAQKLQAQLSRLEQAMTDETMALHVLQKDIDHNQMTLTVASMILDGFQNTGEPFLTSLLHLWRAWSIKFLKEKARITIGAGALLLGCVDETAVLRGHFDNAPKPSADASNDEKTKYLPQIFVQISKNSDGKPEVMLGPMLLARNPSLHPGDVRVVCGVDVPQLHHLKDVVVLPQTGDRDIAGMCSGGDLDGDDFLVIWDQDLLPSEWNHEPMDYTRPPMEQPKEDIKTDDLTTFFVTYMKNDGLPSIAHAHTANADYLEEGVKSMKCLKLANLHSMAVDYVKTGQPAQLTQDLKPLKWPHFMEKVGKKQHQIYTSKKVLGQLYDQVERIDFVPAFTAPFDTRILHAYALDENILQSVRQIKEEYDAHMRRIMAQQEIKTEFEVWSTFVLQHSSTSNSFKYHEQIGEISMALKDQFRLICYERAGGEEYERIAPFAAAMYQVTAREVTTAVEECHRVQMVGGQPRPLREVTPSAMPLMSFPWLFHDVLGKIAKSNTPGTVGILPIQGDIDSEAAFPPDVINAPRPKRTRVDPGTLDSGDYLETSKGTTHPGQLLELFGQSNEFYEQNGAAETKYIPSTSTSVKSSISLMDTSVEHGSSANDELVDPSSSSSPELLIRRSLEDDTYIAEALVESDSRTAISLASHLTESTNPLYSQGKTQAVRLAGKEQGAPLNEKFFERFDGDSQVLSIEPDYNIPEGSNLRLLKDLTTDATVHSDEPKDPIMKFFHNEEENAFEDVSLAEEKAAKTDQLSKAELSDEMEKDEEKKTVAREKEKNDDADDGVGYSSDSDVESGEVVLSTNTKAGLLDQLAKIAADDSALHINASNHPPTAIQDSTDQELDRSESCSVLVSLIPESESRTTELD